MKLIKIDDINIPELSIYKTLRDNESNGTNSFIADSPKVVNLLLESAIEVHSILATEEYYQIHTELIESKNISTLYVADKKRMQNIVGHTIHHNCMMHGRRPAQTALENLDDTILMLDGVTSTENIGSIARSMAALGIRSYLLPSTSPHPYTRRALRVSMGYMSKLKYKVYDDVFSTIAELKQRGYKVFAAEVCEGSTPLMKVKTPPKWVLIMGHEGKGIAQEILDICDEVLTIEMQEDVKSLNVSVAASLIMYTLQKV